MAASTEKPYGDVTYADPGYQADNKKRYPLDSEEHCRAAWSYINQAGNAAKYTAEQLSNIKGRIMAAGKKYGITFESASRSADPIADPALFLTAGIIHRTVPLEDISVKAGRTVEAYLAVFDTEAEIRDGQGHYKETIDRSAFNKAISDARPQGSRTGWKTSVYYNHAMTPYGTPSERWSTPVAVTRNLVVESRGVVATDHYMETPEGDHALELVRAGAVKGYSFTGRLIRSDPNRPPAGGFRASRNGTLPVVRRHELGLQEYGPTPEPAYETAGVLGVRADFARLLAAHGYTPEEAMRLLPLLSATPDGEPADSDTSDNSEAVAVEPLIEHSVRQSPFARRLQVALTARGMRSDDEAAGHPRPADGRPSRTA